MRYTCERPTNWRRSRNNFQEVCNLSVNDECVLGVNVINVSVSNHNVSAIIDTGAAITVAPMRIMSHIPGLRRCKIQTSNYSAIKLADDRQIPIKGVINAVVYVAGKKTVMSIHLVENLKQRLIIGVDFLTKYRAVIDVANKRLKLRSALTVKAKQGFSVPPLAEYVTSGKLNTGLPDQIFGHTKNIKTLNH